MLKTRRRCRLAALSEIVATAERDEYAEAIQGRSVGSSNGYDQDSAIGRTTHSTVASDLQATEASLLVTIRTRVAVRMYETFSLRTEAVPERTRSSRRGERSGRESESEKLFEQHVGSVQPDAAVPFRVGEQTHSSL